MVRPAKPVGYMIFLFLAGVLVYSNAIGHPFVHDDVVFIQNNPHIAQLDGFGDVFFKPSVAGSSVSAVNPYYRPLLELVYRLEYRLFGFNPYGFHLINILIHALNGILVFLLFSSLGMASLTAFAGALLFLVHPIQTEAVACIAGISNLMFAFFLLVSINCYIWSRQCTSPSGGILWGVSLGTLLLAMFAKEQAVIGPFLFLFYELFDARRKIVKLSERLKPLAGVFLVGIFYFIIHGVMAGGMAASVLENTAELKLRLLTIPKILLTYLGIFIAPVHLHYYRSVDILGPCVLAFAALGIITVKIPSLRSASISSLSISTGIITEREKLPQ